MLTTLADATDLVSVAAISLDDVDDMLIEMKESEMKVVNTSNATQQDNKEQLQHNKKTLTRQRMLIELMKGTI
jgi:hypothetical protein